MQTSSRFSCGYLIVLIATVLWSFTGILISHLSKTYSLPSLVLAFWRDLFVSFSMAIGLLVLSRKRFHLEPVQRLEYSLLPRCRPNYRQLGAVYVKPALPAHYCCKSHRHT
jgi:drug/metabolite transporter (DMT)-like permease